MALLALLASVLSLSVAVQANGGNGRLKPLPAETARIPSKAAYFPEYDSERVTIKYGAVTVPPMTENDGMAQYAQRVTTLPCQDCFITFLQFDVEHADGRTADAQTGMWLHHGVLVNRNQTDAVCGGLGQRFAASGNERTGIDISAAGSFKGGYYIDATDEVSLVVDLMNLHQSTPQDDIIVSITYEYVLKSHARDFAAITPYWLDVGGCGSSDKPAYEGSNFIYTSPVLLGTQQGTITFVGGHLHDGGTHINLIKDGKVVCAASAAYDSYDKVDGDGGTTEHISSIETCSMTGETTPGDGWFITAYYDTTLHEPMALMDGSLEPVMGIMLVYVASSLAQPLELARPKYWTVVIGVGCLAAIVVGIAAWLLLRERKGISLSLEGVRSVGGLLYKDSPREQQEAAVPLMNA